MFKRILIVVCLLTLLLPAAAYAQQPPQAVTDAIAILNQKLGMNLTIADMASWAWEQKNFPDTSLGCPLAGQTYTPVVTSGFVVTLTYNGVTYDIRVSADRQIKFLCSPGGGAPGGTAGAGVIPSPIPTLPPVVTANPPTSSATGSVLCPGGQIARLAVGMQGQAITTGSINIRATAGATGQVAGLLLPQGIFSVTGGPQCVGNQTWWQISYTTQTSVVTTGWVMEGDAPANDYWLQPYGVTAPAPSGATPGTRITTANAGLIRAVTQAALPYQAYQAALPPEVSPNMLMINLSRETRLYNSALSPLLTFGTNLMELVAVAPLGSGSYRLAAAEVVSGNPTLMNLWVWTVTPGAAAPAITGQYGVMVPWTNSLTFSPDGKRLAAGTGRLPTGDPAAQNGVWVWDTSTNAQIAGIPFAAPVAGVAFSPDGSVIAAATTDNTVHLWSLATNTELAALSSPVNTTMRVRTVAFSPNGTQLAVIGSDWAVRVWDMATRTLKYTLPATPNQFPRQMVYSPDSALLVTGGDTSMVKAFLAIWDTASGVQLTTQTDFDENVIGLGFNPDGTQLNVVGLRNWGVWAVP